MLIKHNAWCLRVKACKRQPASKIYQQLWKPHCSPLTQDWKWPLTKLIYWSLYLKDRFMVILVLGLTAHILFHTSIFSLLLNFIFTVIHMCKPKSQTLIQQIQLYVLCSLYLLLNNECDVIKVHYFLITLQAWWIPKSDWWVGCWVIFYNPGSSSSLNVCINIQLLLFCFFICLGF